MQERSLHVLKQKGLYLSWAQKDKRKFPQNIKDNRKRKQTDLLITYSRTNSKNRNTRAHIKRRAFDRSDERTRLSYASELRRVEPTEQVRWAVLKACHHEQSLHVSSLTDGWKAVRGGNATHKCRARARTMRRCPLASFTP